MSKAQHTPGPWNASSHGDIVSAKHGEVDICAVFGRPQLGEGEANASIIAAAPELLEALKDILKNPNSALYHNIARAAIAKAEGE